MVELNCDPLNLIINSSTSALDTDNKFSPLFSCTFSIIIVSYLCSVLFLASPQTSEKTGIRSFTILSWRWWLWQPLKRKIKCFAEGKSSGKSWKCFVHERKTCHNQEITAFNLISTTVERIEALEDCILFHYRGIYHILLYWMGQSCIKSSFFREILTKSKLKA